MGKLRGKQHGQRVDADIRRTAQQVAAHATAERQAEAAKIQARRSASPVDPAQLAGAVVVQDRDGFWHEVARVNAKTVSVKPNALYPFGHRLPHDRIVRVHR